MTHTLTYPQATPTILRQKSPTMSQSCRSEGTRVSRPNSSGTQLFSSEGRFLKTMIASGWGVDTDDIDDISGSQAPGEVSQFLQKGSLRTTFHVDSKNMYKDVGSIVKARFSVHGEVSKPRVVTFTIVYSRLAEVASALVTLINFLLIMQDTDLAAKKQSTPDWLLASNSACLLFFTIELSSRAYVERRKVFLDGWNLVDLLVVVSGLVNVLFFHIIGSDTHHAAYIRSIRCIRLFRVFRAFSLLSHAKHFRSIVRSIGVCIKILFWSFSIFFIFMTMWATLAVEMLHPLMDDVRRQTPAWDGCVRCSRSFESVMAANLTLLQTIIAGDSWGQVAIPVIEAYPAASIIFVGSLFTISVGVLNLVCAVLVDAAAEARDGDVHMRAIEMRRNELYEKQRLNKMFRMIDTDTSGGISFDELQYGAENVAELRELLATMDIQDEELEQLFAMLDEDGSGEVDPAEFIRTLYRLQCGNNKTAATFVKHYVLHMKKNQVEMLQNLSLVEGHVKKLRKLVGSKIVSPSHDAGDHMILNGSELVHSEESGRTLTTIETVTMEPSGENEAPEQAIPDQSEGARCLQHMPISGWEAALDQAGDVNVQSRSQSYPVVNADEDPQVEVVHPSSREVRTGEEVLHAIRQNACGLQDGGDDTQYGEFQFGRLPCVEPGEDLQSSSVSARQGSPIENRFPVSPGVDGGLMRI